MTLLRSSRRFRCLLQAGAALALAGSASGQGEAAMPGLRELQARKAELQAQLREVEAALRAAQPEPARPSRDLRVRTRQRSVAPAPTSSLEPRQALRAAELMSLVVPGSAVQTVLDTGSMQPAFGSEVLLLAEPAPFADLRVGDIVTYVEPRAGQLVVHRLVERRGDRFLARGDANGRTDPGYVTLENYQMRIYGMLYTRTPPLESQD